MSNYSCKIIVVIFTNNTFLNATFCWKNVECECVQLNNMLSVGIFCVPDERIYPGLSSKKITLKYTDDAVNHKKTRHYPGS